MKPICTFGTIAAAALALAGCATPSDRISAELLRYGLDQRQADCVGNRLEARLSLAQLQQLARAAKAYSSSAPDPRRLTTADFARISGEINDPRIPIEVGTAAMSCGVLGSLLSR